MTHCNGCSHITKVIKGEDVKYICTCFIVKRYLRKENSLKFSEYYEILVEDAEGLLKCQKCLEGEERMEELNERN